MKVNWMVWPSALMVLGYSVRKSERLECEHFYGFLKTGGSVESDTFYGDFIVKLMQRLSGNLMCNDNIRLPDQLHENPRQPLD